MNARRFTSSREKIVQLLRRAQHSVNDLARALRLTDNAVRANLARLERDGLVQLAGSRASVRKPESIYDITPQAERLFAKAYAPALATVLAVMEAGADEKELEIQLREAGRRLAAPHLPSLAGLPFPQRAEKTLQILEDLGGLADLEDRDGQLYVRGFGCPFSQIVTEHPKLCLVAQVLVGELLGCEVQEQCQRGDRPKCCFVVK
ncbi:MAG: ArsR family transcriptional regulator [Tepidisphaeraceae bacterium]